MLWFAHGSRTACVACDAVRSSSWGCPSSRTGLWRVANVRDSYVLFKEMTLVGYKHLHGGRQKLFLDMGLSFDPEIELII